MPVPMTDPTLMPPSPVNPAGAPGSTQGDPNAILNQLAPLRPQLQGIMAPNDRAALLQKIQARIAARDQAGPPKPQGGDLSGLMMAADFANGTSKFSNAWKNQQEQEDQATKQEEKRQQDLTGDQIGLLKDTKPNMGNPGQAIDQLVKNSRADFKPILDDEAEANKVISVLNSHNPAAILGVKEALTRLMVGARPQAQLIATQGQDPSFAARIENYIDMARSGNMRPENTAQINQMVSDLNTVTQARRQGAIDRHMAYGRARGVDDVTTASLIPDTWSNPASNFAAQAKQEGAKSTGVAEGKADYAAEKPNPGKAPQFSPDVVAYAQKHGITPIAAQQIKMQRTAGDQ
jgi:hypothetical protein